MYKKKISLLMFSALVCGLFSQGLPLVHAAVSGSVVINEVAWAGSGDSANDEWIELFNPSDSSVDLAGWMIDDDHGASLYHLSGTIPAHGYFVIEDVEGAVQPLNASAIVNVSLANSGDSLTLLDSSGNIVDEVNGNGVAWYAGNSTSHATMERKDPVLSGNESTNWASSSGSGNGNTSSLGGVIVGTPGSQNSVYVLTDGQDGSQGGQGSAGGQMGDHQTSVSFSSISQNYTVGQGIDVAVNIGNASGLFNYGFDVLYDPAVFRFRSVEVGDFLSQSGVVPTSFQAGLENGIEGKLVIAEARTMVSKIGVDGAGTLCVLHFDTVGSATGAQITFGSGSFISGVNGDEPVSFLPYDLMIETGVPAPVSGLRVVGGVDRYSLQISWDVASDATGYDVFRMDAHGQWKFLGNVQSGSFVDRDGIIGGGNIVPTHEYSYKVVAVSGAKTGTPMTATGVDMRGLSGDMNRSDRVDGRDLELLAIHFGDTDTVLGFDPLVDTTYDGEIDGSDLIDIGLHFGKTYQ